VSDRHTHQASDSGVVLHPPTIGLRLEAGGGVDYQDKFRGAMIGTGIGDALGRPAEGMSPAEIRNRYGTITDFEPSPGGPDEPIGLVTDDTEMALCIAESIVECSGFDPIDVANRFAAWIPVGRGIGSATAAACYRMRNGVPWHEAGSESAGNGAAMRAAPLALAAPFDVDQLRTIATQSAVITHDDPTAALSTVITSFIVAYLLHTPPGSLDVDDLRRAIHRAATGLADVPRKLRHRRGEASLLEVIDDVFERRDQSVPDIFAFTHNGAFVLESLPAAIGSFLAGAEDPERTVIDAVAGGYDADTIAAMAGAFTGAYHGASAFPRRWRDRLEFRSGLAGLADDLLNRAGIASSGRPLPDEAEYLCYTPRHIRGELWITEAHRRAAADADGPDREGIRLQPHPAGAMAMAAALIR
jgi:ADP-ribosyl-[dinitrogen reductase] hydrolase